MKVLLAPDEIQFFQVPGIARGSQNMPQEVRNMVVTPSTQRGSTLPEVFLNLWVFPEPCWKVPLRLPTTLWLLIPGCVMSLSRSTLSHAKCLQREDSLSHLQSRWLWCLSPICYLWGPSRQKLIKIDRVGRSRVLYQSHELIQCAISNVVLTGMSCTGIIQIQTSFLRNFNIRIKRVTTSSYYRVLSIECFWLNWSFFRYKGVI